MKKIIRRIAISIFSIIALVILLDLIFPLPNLKSYSKVIYSNDGTLMSAFLTSDDKWRMRTELENVSPELIKAILKKEDNWFFWHLGVNPISIIKALIQNISEARIVSGGSTITMQTVRLLEPADRTYWNKFLEMLRAFQIELHYSKDEILETYLSLVPYGGNVEGVRSASFIFLNKPPDKLSLAEAVLLTVIPNDPNSLRIDTNPESARLKRNKWLKHFKNENFFSERDINDALYEPVIAGRYEIETIAPHLSNYLNMKLKKEEIHTTLDIRKQRIAERLLSNHVSRVRSKDVSNGAVLIINNKTHAIEVYCGSADFYDNKNSGQVDGVRAIRSPGSTLKPGLYGLAFDMGILTPKMLLYDLPTDFNSYQPENYTNEYHGAVTAEFALRQSLNVPAVNLLKEVGFNKYLNLLIKAGFIQIKKDRRKLGLSLILGGCGVTLKELTEYFSSFANGGSLFPAVIEKGDYSTDSIKLFSSAACYMLSEILSGIERPDLPNELIQMTELPKIAWKTGTSYGKRDAWAIGYNPNYTIGVWIGNFDGKGAPHLAGAAMAVPLLFDLFNAIDHRNNRAWFAMPDDCLIRSVCDKTGQLPGKYCNAKVDDYYIKNVSHKDVCELQKEIYISKDSSISYCKQCLPDSGYVRAVYPVYDPELTLWYETNGISYRKMPEHNPECTARFTGEGPKIISPSDNFEYFIEENSGQQILLQAASKGNVSYHYWYINDKFYKKCKPGQRIFYPALKGKIKITCIDANGRTADVHIEVKYY